MSPTNWKAVLCGGSISAAGPSSVIAMTAMLSGSTSAIAHKERSPPLRLPSNSASPWVSRSSSRQAPWSARQISARLGIAGSGRREIEVEHRAVDVGERRKIGDGHALVHLVHGKADEAKLCHRAVAMDEAGIRGAAGGAELGRASRHLLDRTAQDLADGTRRG